MEALLEYMEINEKDNHKDIRSYNIKLINKTIVENNNMAVLKTKMSAWKQEITKLKDRRGLVIFDTNLTIQIFE